MKERRTHWIITGLAPALILAAVALPTPAVDTRIPQLPQFLFIATNGQESLFYSLGGVVARVIDEATGIRARVKPYSGSSAYLPAISQGKVDMGINNTNDARAAYRGIEPFAPSPNVRAISVLCPVFTGILVKNDSDIRTLRDLRGRRISAKYPAQLSVKVIIEACLATANMDWGDVVQVPVVNAAQGVQALMEGRVDAACFAVTGSKIQEAEASIRGGVRFLPLEHSPEAAARMAGIFPGAYPWTLSPDTPGHGVIRQETSIMGYDIFVTAGTGLSPDAAYAVTKALYDGEKAVQKGHDLLSRFRRDRMIEAGFPIPYHDGAVSFYREIGLWTSAMDGMQRNLLSEAAR